MVYHLRPCIMISNPSLYSAVATAQLWRAVHLVCRAVGRRRPSRRWPVILLLWSPSRRARQQKKERESQTQVIFVFLLWIFNAHISNHSCVTLDQWQFAVVFDFMEIDAVTHEMQFLQSPKLYIESTTRPPAPGSNCGRGPGLWPRSYFFRQFLKHS